MGRDQVADAQFLYDPRAHKYDDSFHVRFARHMVELSNIKSGEDVLDLACGTGLVSYPASSAVGASGSVTGVDVSTGMLRQAEAKKEQHPLKNVSFHHHSITQLDTLDAVKGRQFDAITCASALVLLPHPDEALKLWATYLKPGGRLIVDVTHPQNLTRGVLFERVGNILERPLPTYRLRFQKPEDLQSIMQTAGLHPVEMKRLLQLDIEGTDKLEDYILPDSSNSRVWKEHDITDIDRIFDEMVEQRFNKSLASPDEVREQAREVYKEEWSKAANSEGKVQEFDEVFVGIGWKP